MTPKQISQMIEKEIGSDWSMTNWHGCDLKKCLVRPKKRKVLFGEGMKEVWIVLEEDPENLNKIKIYFDDEAKKFGLVLCASDSHGFACNSYGKFLEAFKAM